MGLPTPRSQAERTFQVPLEAIARGVNGHTCYIPSSFTPARSHARILKAPTKPSAGAPMASKYPGLSFAAPRRPRAESEEPRPRQAPCGMMAGDPGSHPPGCRQPGPPSARVRRPQGHRRGNVFAATRVIIRPPLLRDKRDPRIGGTDGRGSRPR